MKRIAYVLKGYPRVSETFIAQEIYLLEQQGFNIEIISMRKAREPQRQPIVDKIKAPITYIPEYIGPAWRSFLRSFLYVTRRSPFRSLFWSSKALIRSGLNQNMSPIKRFLQATWICEKKDLLGKNPSALHHLHSHFVHTPTELTFFISKLTQIPYSISAHAKDIYTISLDEIRERVNHSRLLMTCTGYNVEFLKKIPGIAQNRIYRVYHGIDLENFKRKSPLSHTRLSHFLSVGRLVQKKGYPDILQALAILKGRGLHFQYDIMGSGDMKAELENLVEVLGLQDRVKFHNTVTHPQVIARMEEGGIFLCGSHLTEDGDRDGIPNTAAEAMAMELPVLATATSGIPELIESGKSGWLVEERDVKGFADHLEQMLAHPESTVRLGVAARAKVEQIFNATNCIQDCSQLLRPLAE